MRTTDIFVSILIIEMLIAKSNSQYILGDKIMSDFVEHNWYI